MKIFKAGFIFAAVTTALPLASCGGGESSSSSYNSPSETTRHNSGGTVASPSVMSFVNGNEIKEDPFENYFKVTAAVGDTIIIRSSLQNTLDSQEIARCNYASNFTISITNITSHAGSCTRHLKYTFESTGVYNFHFKYPRGNYGYFDATIIPAGSTFTSVASGTGRPNDPRPIITGGADNALSGNDFFNNFAFDAKAGDTLHIQTYPDVQPSSTDKARCTWSSGDYVSNSSYGVLTSDVGRFNCSEVFEHRYEKAGRYYLSIRFIGNTKGFFRAIVVPSN